MKADAIGSHALCGGFVTQATMNGVREFLIVRQTGHKTLPKLRRYIRSGDVFRENAAAERGLKQTGERGDTHGPALPTGRTRPLRPGENHFPYID